MQPGKFTELFFLDDATAFAAGHRPCALCRRADYDRVLAITGHVGADALDAQLHVERSAAPTPASLDELPDGAFVLHDDEPWLVLGARLLRWTASGYVEPRPRPGDEQALVITPPSLVAVLRAGWRPLVPFLHPSAS